MALQAVRKRPLPHCRNAGRCKHSKSFPRRRESSVTLDDSRPESIDLVSRRLLDPIRDQGDWVPACAGMTLKVGSTMARMALFNEFYAAYHSHWIPACAGMTWGAGRTLKAGRTLVRDFYAAFHVHWIPACAGMTGVAGVALSQNRSER